MHAEVQRPAVTLAQCRLHEDTVYVGVGTERRVAMVNTSLIPTHFTWSKQVQYMSTCTCTCTHNYYVSCAHGAIHMFICTTLWSQFRPKTSSLAEKSIPLVQCHCCSACKMYRFWAVAVATAVSLFPHCQAALDRERPSLSHSLPPGTLWYGCTYRGCVHQHALLV